MFESDCRVCEKEVTSTSKAVACEKCNDWFHVWCVGLRGVNMKVLRCKNLLFLCTPCLNALKSEWDTSLDKGNKGNNKPEEGNKREGVHTPSQTEETEIIKEDQEEEVEQERKGEGTGGQQDRSICSLKPTRSRSGSPSQVLCSALTQFTPASPRVPAGPAIMCAARGSAAVEAVSDRKQQDQSPSGVGRHRCDDKNHPEAGSSLHKGESKFESQQYANTFKSKKKLKRHTLTHSDVVNYECQQCGKKFPYKSRLTTHTLTHSGVRNYECLECGKKFVHKTHLFTHTLTHDGIRNYECQECGKRFTQKSSLTTHTLTHSGVRNYECQDCGKRFVRKFDVIKHALTHSGIRNYECQECGRRFSTRPYLKEHILRHTGLREFKCDVCGKCFKTKSDITKHVQIHF